MLDPGPGEAHQDGESNEGDGGDGEEHRLVRGTQGQVVDRSLYLGHDIDEGDGGDGEEHRLVRGTQGQVLDRRLYLGHDNCCQ